MALVYHEIARNKVRSVILLVIFVMFVGGLGYLFGEAYGKGGGLVGVGMAAIIAIIYALITYFAGTNIALALSGAKLIEKRENPELYQTVENLAIAAGLPTPKIYLIHDSAPNAFATGRDPKHAVIAVTSGILQKLEKVELEGVLAHELSHIGNYDTRYLMISMVLIGVVALISDAFLRSSFHMRRSSNRKGGGAMLIIALIMAILAPLFASLMQLAISRKREYLADASGALLTRYPEGLARALEKISKDTEPLEVANRGTAPMYIINPLKGKSIMNLFATHPPIEERVKRLRGMGS